MRLRSLRPLHIPYTVALAVIYLIAAWAIIVNPNAPVRMMDNTGISNDFFVIVLGFSAAILLTRPNVLWYVISLLPLGLYAVYAVICAISLDMPNAAVITVYSIMVAVYPLAYRLCSRDGWKIHHVYGVTLLPLSVAIFASPALGTVAFIQSAYGIYSFVLAISIGAGAFAMLLLGTPRSFWVVLFMVMLFAATSVYVGVINRNFVGSTINLLVFITAVYTLSNTNDYFGVKHAPRI